MLGIGLIFVGLGFALPLTVMLRVEYLNRRKSKQQIFTNGGRSSEK